MGGGINLSFVVEERRRKLSFQGKGNGKVWKKKIYMWLCVVFFLFSNGEGLHHVHII